MKITLVDSGFFIPGSPKAFYKCLYLIRVEVLYDISVIVVPSSTLSVNLTLKSRV